mgnify:CR=1 FL=1
MKPVYQAGRPTGCMAACVASILEVELNGVPDCFDARDASGKETWDHFAQRDWLAERDYGVVEFKLAEGAMWPPTGGMLCILSGPSPRDPNGTLHAVVARTLYDTTGPFELVHDPYWSGIHGPLMHQFFNGQEPTIVTFLVPVNDKICPVQVSEV